MKEIKFLVEGSRLHDPIDFTLFKIQMEVNLSKWMPIIKCWKMILDLEEMLGDTCLADTN